MPSGLLAVITFGDELDLSTYASYGLLSLQHRGGEKQIVCARFSNEVTCEEFENPFDIKRKKIYDSFIAATVDRETFNLAMAEGKEEKILAVSERPSDALDEFLRELVKLGKQKASHLGEIASKYTKAEIPTFLAITSKNEIIASRDSRGLSPLSIGGYGFDMAIISSESIAIDVLDCELKRHLLPNEVVYASPKLFKIYGANASELSTICLFELLYTSRHDAVIDSVSVYEFRKELGRELAKSFSKDVDIVVGVPETAYPYAIGLAQALGKPFEMSFIPTSTRLRAMLRATGRERLIAVHLKMNPVSSAMQGKKIALVDDSMVTGATIKTVSQILRNKVGVEEIHLLIASPKVVRSCPYGVFPIDEKSLIASNLSDDNIAKYLDVDSITWLDRRNIESVAKKFNTKFCDLCFKKALGD